MLQNRVMPCLLLKDGALVKTRQFKDPAYVGDPINAIRIFNEKEVDELVLLDVTATEEGRCPPFNLISDVASECFMPLTYGGGVSTLDDMGALFQLGVEKVAINSHAIAHPDFISQAARRFGSQSVVVAMDVRRRLLGRYEVCSHRGRKWTGMDPAVWARSVVEAGAGEIFLSSIDCDGMMQGYDIELLRRVTAVVNVPVIACGGAGKVADFGAAIHEGGASACAAGSLVVYYGRNRAVLINFPERMEIEAVLNRPAKS